MPQSSTSNSLTGSLPVPVGIQAVTLKLLEYCRANEWAGYDPYDALNSELLKALRFLDFKLARLALTQLLKRSPINVRGLMLVPKKQNPKALGLFLASMVKLEDTGVVRPEGLVEQLIERLRLTRSEGTAYWCWGYSFPWQMRTKLVPMGAPNLVCTTFVAEALLDAYESRNDARCLEMAISAAEYIVNELFWTERESASFSYPLPTLRVPVHNANFLASAFLCRVYKQTGDKRFLAPALKVARYSAAKQSPDGSWLYGEASTQNWIDNFHTGYNLGGLRSISRSLATSEFDDVIRKGFDFYLAHFFREDGAPRYFHNKTYPIDVHCVAQSIITLSVFRDLSPNIDDQLRAVLDWAVRNMWDDRGFFYYRVLRTTKVRISYMRWSQAWMLTALATALSQSASGSRSAMHVGQGSVVS